MISTKSKFKVFLKPLIVELALVVLTGYLSTLMETSTLKAVLENFSITLSLVMAFELCIIFFSFNYKEKQDVLQQVTFTMEQIFQIVFSDYYRLAVALDVLSKRMKNREKEDGI